MWNHWVVRANTPFEPFQDFDVARRTWISLSKAFRNMLSAVLMPNHLHLILPYNVKIAPERKKLAGIISRIKRKSGTIAYWQPIPDPTFIPDRHHLRRQLRYIALNPCRKSLCADPLEWYWSTYREVMGATVLQTVSAERLAFALGESKTNFQVRFHSYVSGDPSVKVGGTPMPFRCSPQILRYHSLYRLLAAASAALRVQEISVRSKGSNLRALFIHLAIRHGWKGEARRISEICQIIPRAVYFQIKKQCPPGLEAAELCLSDDRLLPKLFTLRL